MRPTLLLLMLSVVLGAQTPVFTATSGTACTATWDATAKLLSIDCQVNGKAVMPGGMKIDPAQLLGVGNGLVLSVNGVGMLFKRQKTTDQLYWEVASDTITLKSGTIAVP